jgi:hypothetical protein
MQASASSPLPASWTRLVEFDATQKLDDVVEIVEALLDHIVEHIAFQRRLAGLLVAVRGQHDGADATLENQVDHLAVRRIGQVEVEYRGEDRIAVPVEERARRGQARCNQHIKGEVATDAPAQELGVGAAVLDDQDRLLVTRRGHP